MKRLRIWHRFEEKASDCISSLAVFAFFSLWHLVLVGIKSSNEYTLAFICELFSCTAECPIVYIPEKMKLRAGER
jgi:hypothetical protein